MYMHNHQYQQRALRNQTVLLYSCSAIIGFVGLVYASVPLYRLFCQQTGFGGTPMTTASISSLDPQNVQAVKGARPIRIVFVSTTSQKLPWQFKPIQRALTVIPGQTALAFYTAENIGTSEVSGVATYNVIPAKAAQYFNKIQCFCFEEQKLAPGEQIDMPVFFYLDPEFAYDPNMDNIGEIVLSYTFFKAEQTKDSF